MKNNKKHKNRQAIWIIPILYCFVLLYANLSFAQNQNNNIELRYGKHENFDRFVFDIPQKIDFNIIENSYYTSIVFPKETKISSRSLTDYKHVNMIKNEILPNNKVRFSIPAKMINHFNTPNKIVIDVINAPNSQKPSFSIDDIIIINDEKNISDIDNSMDKTISDTSKPSELENSASLDQVEKKDSEDIEKYIKRFEGLQESTDIAKVEEDEKNRGRTTSLGFSWTEQVGAAMFKRKNSLWIVFDKKKELNTNSIAESTKGFATEIIQIPNQTSSILKIKLKPDINATIRKEGLLWIIDLIDTPIVDIFDRKLSINTQHESKNNVYLFIPTNRASDIISTYDPEYGDTLTFITVFDLKLNVEKKHEYPEFNILPSVQGIVVENFTDNLVINRSNSGVTIKGKDSSLNISYNLDLLDIQARLLDEKDWIESLTNELPIDLADENFIETLDMLKNNIKISKAEEKAKAKFMLAKYYIVKGLGFEAAIVLEDLINEENEIPKENLHGLLGIANFLKEDYIKAKKDFSFGRLTEYNEAVLWKQIAQSAIQNNPEGHDFLKTYLPIIRSYPTELKDKIAKIAVKASIDVSDDITAQDFLSILENSVSSRNYSSFIDYWNFEIFAIQGYARNAQAKLIDAAKNVSPKYSAMARRKYIILNYHSGKKSAEETIFELERLKYVWREKDFKILILEDLYSTYYSIGDYYNSMLNMNKLYEIYDDPKKEESILKNMIQLFENIFIHEQDGSLSPTRIIALYNDFSWIADKSERNNEIIINIADRLVSIDLIERAHKILDIQIDKESLSKEERAITASRLALINIFREYDKEAIKIIDKNTSDDLPEYIKHHHRIIKTQALINLKEYEKALKILENDYSRKAIILKNNIYMIQGEWSKSADTLKMLIKIPEEGETISDEQAIIVLDWIISLKKAKKDTVIVFARDKLKPFFKDSRYLSTFNMLTTELPSMQVDIKKIGSFINDISHFSKFIKSYNDFLGSNSIVEENKKDINV